MVHSIDSIKKMRKDILMAAVNDYQALKEVDRKAEAENLKPGQTMGFTNYDGFYALNYRDEADKVLKSYSAKMGELLNEVQGEIKIKASEPPTTEQANLLTALSVGAPTKEELQHVLDANSGNYAMYNALNRLAEKNGYYLNGESPIKSLVDLSNNLQSSCNTLNIHNGANLTPGFVEFTEMMGE